ncbi:MAG: T9SS C-terminal target domain-containing protein [Bacteroidetes bacterium]|nr:MAG: T9SS C-terminal target domain-containing protein [Bacteroidota bacterium]MBL1145017.1 T9SS C-terminal target domain-containing protein [Bacteroidota bacterium]NOG57814.1 T9SS type A sorting domain-containing protein [Bacteroidota bacterium]
MLNKTIKDLLVFSGRLMMLFLLLVKTSNIYSEGTAQWMPVGMVSGQEMSLCVFNTPDGNDRLGTTGCNADERIFITVSSDFANERIYIGMNKFSSSASYFRVMDPNGTQVYPTTPGTLQAVLSSGTGHTGEGYIATLTEARNGPIEVYGAGGYDAISITPAMAGNYYIEFNGTNSTTYSKGSKHQISYFDVTVANTNGLPEGSGNHTAINGRLNALQWSLYNKTSGTGFNDVDAEFFLYQSDDSLVLAVQWDQVKAGGWNIAFTRYGIQNTGDYKVDRQSLPYSTIGKGSVDGEFPIFVNNPDTNIYPSAGELPRLNFLEYDRCSGSTCFLYNITKGGQVEILIDMNENGTFDPGTSDRLLVDNKPAGTHCLAWDDLDGLGDLVVAGQAQAVIKYQAGIFHMPLGDVEANPNGFNRTLVRPLSFVVATDPGRIYYDHTQAGGAFGASDYDFEGVTSNGNVWSPDDGNQLYLNTWFSFAELRDTLIVTFNTCDKDDDGLSDVLDIDDDNDGIPDIVEMYNGDHDGDGTPDYEDADFCLATFHGVNGWDCADGLPDPSDDLDGDGIRNALDSDFPGCGSTLTGACSNYDSDLDGIPDYLDRDSDNDGISDLIEIGGVDTDGDGVIDDLTDTDGDGLADDYDNDDTDGPTGSSPCVNQPGCLQGVSTNPLLDSDNDGSTDNERDTDGDGFPDYIDLDSDNDGIPDVVEVGGTDEDGDGFADNYIDSDNDGFNDITDGQICTDSTDIGTSTYIPGSSNSVDNGTNANGQPNGTLAELYSFGDYIVMDFGVTLPVGTDYIIYWKRKNYGDDSFTSDMVVEESTSPGSGYSTHSVSPSTNSENDVVSTLMQAENSLRYLKLSLVSGSNDDFDLDAVKYFYNEEQCVAGNPILVTGVDGNNDGEPDSYPTDDTDGDGVLDHLDLDADNDGIPDVVEAGGTDSDGDGRADNYVDTDNDGFNDKVDGDVGNNGTAENSSNALLLTGADTDDDGVPNSYPYNDADKDGITDQLDLDADNDGIPDVVEAGGTDKNGDGRADNYTDSDNDGFNDDVDGDVGNDGTAENSANALTLTGTDTDNDGAPNSYPNDDNDKDGILNYIDLDADNDGIPDVVEAGGTDVNGDGRADNYTDSDNDGFNDDVDGDPNNSLAVGDDSDDTNTNNALILTSVDSDNDGAPDSYPNGDHDGDGILNFLDLDADNDGIPDVVEAGGTDVNGDGRADNYSDADNDGFNDDVDGDPDNSLAVGSDASDSNTANALTLTGSDTNNDGAPNSFPNDDKDGDNVYNFLDLDSDDDGILDVIEAGGADTDRDGIEDAYVDVDNDGFNDNVDGDPNNSLAAGDDSDDTNIANVTIVTGVDGDNDGAPDSFPNGDFDGDDLYNFIDIDADNDGIVDNTEGQGTKTYIAPANSDADGDGIDDAYDSDDANFGGINSSFELSDIDSATDADSPDYLDLDTDGDGINDVIEGHDTDGDGVADAGSPANTGLPGGTTDVDNDGLLDGYDNNTSSTDPTNSSLQGTSHPNLVLLITTERDWREVSNPDSDGDGIVDSDDIDDDNDGVLDINEAPCPTPEIRFRETPEAYWTMDNNTNDVSGNGHNERTDGNTPGFSTDAIQGTHSASFNGTSNQIRYSQNGVFMEEAYTEISFSAWIKPSDLSGDRVVYEEGGGTKGLILWLDDGTPTVTVRTSGAGSEASIASDFTLSVDGLWHHVAAVFDNGTILVYVDGIPNSTAAGDVTIGTHGSDGGLGGAHGGTSNGVSGNYAGLMDAVRYDNSAVWTLGRIGFEAQRFCDTDGDEIADHLDLDSDNDGIPDIIEAGGVDPNEDGRVEDDTDTDGDGWANTFDPDNLGVILADEDKDGDGLPNRIDLDADGDGVADIIEAGGVDSDGDAKVDTPQDSDNDGWDNTFDEDNGGTVLTIADNDGDGFNDYLDLDSDSDGITDHVEAQTTVGFVAPTGSDTDGDGWDNSYDSDNGGTAITLSNKDGVGNPDYLDDDSDGDTFPDWIEGFDDDEDGDALNDLLARAATYESSNGNPLLYVNAIDVNGTNDGDGIPDWLEDDDADNVPNFLDSDNTFYSDQDDDGLIDLYDTDNGGVPSITPDSDGDGEYDFRDIDDEITLPIVLLDFTVVKIEDKVQIDWKTSSEINNDYFEIEHAANGVEFKKIALVKGAGNSNTELSYTAIHQTPEFGYNYYRLKQVDFDGKSKTYNSKVVYFNEIQGGGFINVFPNPVRNGALYLELKSPKAGSYLIDLVESNGKLILTKEVEIGGRQKLVRMELLQGLRIAKGVYYLKVKNNSSINNYKIIVE